MNDTSGRQRKRPWLTVDDSHLIDDSFSTRNNTETRRRKRERTRRQRRPKPKKFVICGMVFNLYPYMHASGEGDERFFERVMHTWRWKCIDMLRDIPLQTTHTHVILFHHTLLPPPQISLAACGMRGAMWLPILLFTSCLQGLSTGGDDVLGYKGSAMGCLQLE